MQKFFLLGKFNCNIRETFFIRATIIHNVNKFPVFAISTDLLVYYCECFL
jgi:hypothetical protein